MLIDEAHILFELLGSETGKSILNVCSSDEHFYKVQQSFIWEMIMSPLLKRGNVITNLDMKQSNGVDIVADCTDMKIIRDNTYDIALFTSGVEHIVEVKKALSEIKRILKPEGFMICSAPGVYPRHDDPIDTMLRLPAVEDWEKLLGVEWKIIEFRKSTPVPAKPFYHFNELVFATVIKANPILE